MFELKRKDIIWGYVAQIFSMATGIIILPLILRLLTEAEIGFYYVISTIGSLITLFDFGFSSQFGRNIAYIFSGSKRVEKEGIVEISENSEINYHLLAVMLEAAKKTYRYISVVAFVISLTLGSFYIYHVTDGFTTINNVVIIWGLYSLFIFLNLYYTYYDSFLQGSGKVTESRKSNIFGKCAYLIIAFILLMLRTGLIGVMVANIISVFIQRIIAKSYFFKNELKQKLKSETVTKQEKKDVFSKIWFNAKKQGLVSLAGIVNGKLGIFIAGVYLSLKEMGSYGLLLQFGGLITSICNTTLNTYYPRLCSLRVQNKKKDVYDSFCKIMGFSYFLYILGSLFLLFCIPNILVLIGSNAVLPATKIVVAYLIVNIFDVTAGAAISLVSIDNKIPFMKASLISSAAIIVLTIIGFQFFHIKLFGLILIPGVVQLSYNYWKWPKEIFKNYNSNIFKYIFACIIGFTKFFKEFFGKRNSSL